MLNIICALKHEARPIIAHFRLNHDGSAREFTAYNNEGISITITGVGKRAAYEGTRFAANHFGTNAGNLYLNIGIAGHKDLATGTPVLASRITDSCSGQVWQPGMLLPVDLRSLPLVTVEQPLDEYPADSMVDMEASGFINSAPLERAQCLKIISDNALNPAQNINSKKASALISANIAVIESLLSQLRIYSQQATAATS